MQISSTTSLQVTADTSASTPGYVPAAAASSGSVAHLTKAENAATPAPSPDRVAKAVKLVNDAFAQRGKPLYASIEKDKAAGINVVKVYDKETKEEVSQFPVKAIVAIAEDISQSGDGKIQLMHVSA